MLENVGYIMETFVIMETKNTMFRLLSQMYCHCSTLSINQSIKYIYKALFTSADVTKCCTETQPKTPNNKQCRCRSTVARKSSPERPEPRKEPREEPGYEGWPVLFLLCRVEIITEHGQDVQMFIDGQQGQIIIISRCRGCNKSAPQE